MVEAPPDIPSIGATPTPLDPRLLDVAELRDLRVRSVAADEPVPAPPATAPAPTTPAADAVDAVEAATPEPEVPEAPPSGDDTGRLIRPYAMTGGRTATNQDISLEAQIQTSTRLDNTSNKYRWEAAKILKLAERPMALVELAARAEIPIGVARVVVSDLVDDGALHLQRRVTVTSYTSLLEKVLDGIRDL